MRAIGTILIIFGLVVMMFSLLDKIPGFLKWVYKWGEGIGWIIQTLSVILGLVFLLMANRRKAIETTERRSTS